MLKEDGNKLDFQKWHTKLDFKSSSEYACTQKYVIYVVNNKDLLCQTYSLRPINVSKYFFTFYNPFLHRFVTYLMRGWYLMRGKTKNYLMKQRNLNIFHIFLCFLWISLWWKIFFHTLSQMTRKWTFESPLIFVFMNSQHEEEKGKNIYEKMTSLNSFFKGLMQGMITFELLKTFF